MANISDRRVLVLESDMVREGEWRTIRELITSRRPELELIVADGPRMSPLLAEIAGVDILPPDFVLTISDNEVYEVKQRVKRSRPPGYNRHDWWARPREERRRILGH